MIGGVLRVGVLDDPRRSPPLSCGLLMLGFFLATG